MKSPGIYDSKSSSWGAFAVGEGQVQEQDGERANPTVVKGWSLVLVGSVFPRFLIGRSLSVVILSQSPLFLPCFTFSTSFVT